MDPRRLCRLGGIRPVRALAWRATRDWAGFPVGQFSKSVAKQDQHASAGVGDDHLVCVGATPSLGARRRLLVHRRHARARTCLRAAVGAGAVKAEKLKIPQSPRLHPEPGHLRAGSHGAERQSDNHLTAADRNGSLPGAHQPDVRLRMTVDRHHRLEAARRTGGAAPTSGPQPISGRPPWTA